MTDLTGHCMCGEVRWQAQAAPTWSGICHCEDCRRAVSGPMMPFIGFDRAILNMQGDMCINHSSAGVERGYCAKCYSPMFYRSQQWPEECFVMAATLDDPNVFQPQAHLFYSERLAWVELNDSVPRYAGATIETEEL